jgi:hypothetical protein
VTQLAFAASPPAADLAQGVGSAELAEQHSHELAPTGPDDRATSTRALRDLVPAVTVTCESWVEVYAWVVA